MLGRLLGIWRETAAIQNRSKRLAAIRTSRRAFFEPLESRRVLAGNLDLWPASDGDDQVSISASSSNLIVTLNGVPLAPVSVAGFDSVTVHTGGGADSIQLDSLPTGGSGSANFDESEPNDSIAAADNLEDASWTTAEDPNFGDAVGQFLCAENRCPPPHVTVTGTYTGNDDFFAFSVDASAGSVAAVFDIDLVDQSQFDSFLEILDSSGAQVTFNDDGILDFTGGSANNGLDYTYDAFISHSFTTSGTYYVRVAESPDRAFPFVSGASYTLQVGLIGHAVGGSTPSPLMIVDGGTGSDALQVAANLMPSANVVNVGPAPLAGTLQSSASTVVRYASVETFNSGGSFNVRTDLIALNQQDTIADTTYVRPDASGSNLLIDVNGVTYFGGGLAQLSVIEVIGSSDNDTVTIENVVQNATVYGNAGDDVIHSAAGQDALFGGPGNDWLTGGDGDDRLYGNDGDDQLGGNNGNDVVSGGNGNDKVAGQSGVDLLLGGDGADQVTGNKDRDLLFASGATNGQAGIEGDSQTRGDDDYFAMLALLAAWTDPVFSLGGFMSTGDDGDSDTLFGGHGEDWFVYEFGDVVKDNQDDTLSQ